MVMAKRLFQRVADEAKPPAIWVGQGAAHQIMLLMYFWMI